jgi:hypothetical protein
MRLTRFVPLLLLSLCLGSPAALPQLSDGLVYSKDGSGVFGYKDTPKLPWCDYVVHDPDRPVPHRVDPGPASGPGSIPADAIVLFEGKDLSQWKTTNWTIEHGELFARAGSLLSKETFGDIQLHVEWMAPANWTGPWYNQGNNGVLLMGLYEIQIFDSYNVKWCPDGQAAAVYAQTPPLVNACRNLGQWQTYDILFTAPKFEGEKQIASPRITMLHNGILVHLNQEIYGETGHRVLPGHRNRKSTGPLILAGHDCPVRFRNVWLRKL